MATAVTTVDVYYRTTTHLTDADVATASGDLSAGERARAARFMFPRDRRDYIAAHALLRNVLSQHGGQQPGAWEFATDHRGKPYVIPSAAGPTPAFNLSHATGLVACAVTAEAQVGLDVERIDRGADLLALANRFFAPAERYALAACPQAERQVRFIELWTLKEAFLKACGEGLARPLDSFCFGFEPRGTLRFDGDGESAAKWQFWLFAPGNGHRLALAVTGPAGRRYTAVVHAPLEPRAILLGESGTAPQ